jgi:hypothetical protein
MSPLSRAKAKRMPRAWFGCGQPTAVTSILEPTWDVARASLVRSRHNREGDRTRPKMVQWIDVDKGSAKVNNYNGVDPVIRTVHPSCGSPYVRSEPDNTTSDNL